MELITKVILVQQKLMFEISPFFETLRLIDNLRNLNIIQSSHPKTTQKTDKNPAHMKVTESGQCFTATCGFHSSKNMTENEVSRETLHSEHCLIEASACVPPRPPQRLVGHFRIVSCLGNT